MSRDRLLAAALPVVAVIAMFGFTGATVLAAAGAGTLGYDFQAYLSGAQRLWQGVPLYDLTVDAFGPGGAYFYPPTFALLMAPFGLFDPGLATWLWTGALFVAFGLSVLLLPVARRTRWWILLLGGISWPLVFAIKLGQVGPILLLAFVAGWRWMDRPWRLGAAMALGTAIKIQPALLFGWAIVAKHRRAAAAGLAVLAVLALVATLFAGVSSWVDLGTLLTRVSRPVETPHNMTPSRLALDAGLGESVAWAIQLANWGLVALAVLVGVARCSPVASYLIVVVASQLVSPILWDHYALVLLVPVAWLLDRGRRWAILIPLATSILFVEAIPPIAYPVAYWVTVAALLREGWTGRPLRPQPSPDSGAILGL